MGPRLNYKIQAKDSRPRGHIEHIPKYNKRLTDRPTNGNIEIKSDCKIPTFCDSGVTGLRSPFLNRSIFNFGSFINHVTIRLRGGGLKKGYGHSARRARGKERMFSRVRG